MRQIDAKALAFECPKCGAEVNGPCRYVWPSWCPEWEYTYPGIAEVWLSTEDWPKRLREEMARTDMPMKICHVERTRIVSGLEAKERALASTLHIQLGKRQNELLRQWFQDHGNIFTEHLPGGLCADRSDHKPHLVLYGSLAPFKCTARQEDREPYRSERRRRT